MVFATLQVAGPLLSADRDEPRGTWGGDFLVAYSAGTLAREGRFEDLHDRHRLMDRIKEVGGTTGIEVGASVGPWMNPPFFLWPFMALDSLPYRTALWTWWGISAACIAGASWILMTLLRPAVRAPALNGEDDEANPIDWRSKAIVPLLLVLSMPAFQTFTHGQSSAVSLLLLATVVAFWRRGRGLEAGLALGFLFYKPQLAMLIAAVLVIDQGRRAMLGLTLTGGLLLICTLLTMPQELSLFLQNATGVAASMQSDGVFPWHRHATLAAFWRLLFQVDRSGPSSSLVKVFTLISTVITLIVLAAALLKHRRPALFSSQRSPAQMALRRDRLITATIVAMPLPMPYYVDYDLLLLAVPATLFAGELLRREEPLSVRTGRLAFAWCILFGWLYLNPGIAAITGININVALLALLSARSIVRLLQTSENEPLPAASTFRLRRQQILT